MNESDFNCEKFLSSFETLKIEILEEKKILRLKLNRPKQLNALNDLMFSEFLKFFNNLPKLQQKYDFRIIILTGNGTSFCSGLDLFSGIAQNIASVNTDNERDTGRKAYHIYNLIKYLQESFNVFDDCPIPIIAGIHGYCLGGGINLLSCIDYRIATKNSKYSIKEVDIGLTADLGVLQRLVKQIGNEGLVKKLSYTGEIFGADFACKHNIINEIVENEEELEKSLLTLAEKIAEKSPLVLWGIKRMVNYSRDNTIRNSLDAIATMNSALIQSTDLVNTMQSAMTKKNVMYPKL
jgi:enoyl-CoA hydratase/carnithine racemase